MRLAVQRSARRWGTALVGAGMVAATLLMPGTSAATDPPSMTVVNSASYQAGPVPRGALLTIYTTTRVSPENGWIYNPWVMQAHHGLRVEASCAHQNDFKAVPILYVGAAYDGNHINVYYPNSIGTEPFGRCANSGTSTVRVYPANGGPPIDGEVVMLPAHPGIFMSGGQAPAGDHVDASGTHTALADCPMKIQADAKACTVRTGAGSSKLWVYLTGAEWFLCDPCSTDQISFELATSGDAPESAWVRQTLRSLTTVSNGVEKAVVRLRADTAPGVYWIRVRNTFRSEYPAPLRVEFGQPS